MPPRWRDRSRGGWALPPAVEGWTCQRLAGFGRGIGTWRPRGDADIAGARRSWSLVLKG